MILMILSLKPPKSLQLSMEQGVIIIYSDQMDVSHMASFCIFTERVLLVFGSSYLLNF